MKAQQCSTSFATLYTPLNYSLSSQLTTYAPHLTWAANLVSLQQPCLGCLWRHWACPKQLARGYARGTQLPRH